MSTLNTAAAYWKERQKSYPLPFTPLRLFTDRELKNKAKRWKTEMERAKTGKKRRTDTILADEWEVRWMAMKLFYLADAWILLSHLFPKKKVERVGFFEI